MGLIQGCPQARTRPRNNGFIARDRKTLIASRGQCSVIGCICQNIDKLQVHHILFRKHNSISRLYRKAPKEVLSDAFLNGEVVCEEHAMDAHQNGLKSGCTIQAYNYIKAYLADRGWLKEGYEDCKTVQKVFFKIQDLVSRQFHHNQLYFTCLLIKEIDNIKINEVIKQAIPRFFRLYPDYWWETEPFSSMIFGRGV